MSSTTKEVDELASAVKDGLKVGGDNNNNNKYDRWTLADESTIDYCYLAAAKTKNNSNNDDSADNNNNGVGKSFYISTAINYSNGPAHMGHAYEGTTSDVIARFARLCGDQSVYFVTGSDEHGQKIATTAEESGVKPIDLCNKVRTKTKTGC